MSVLFHPYLCGRNAAEWLINMSEEAKFTVFCLESYKAHKSLSGHQVYDLFQKNGVFDYLRDFYDVLHTTGYQYINRDIDAYLRARNPVHEN